MGQVKDLCRILKSENWFEFIGNSDDTKVASLRRILSIFAYFARID